MLVVSHELVNPITASEAKALTDAYEAKELQTDKDVIFNYLTTTPWEHIREVASNGQTGISFNIGVYNNNDCRVRERYGMRWLKDTDCAHIRTLFQTFGYKIEVIYMRGNITFTISWAQ